jgi:hypothetical protein
MPGPIIIPGPIQPGPDPGAGCARAITDIVKLSAKAPINRYDRPIMADSRIIASEAGCAQPARASLRQINPASPTPASEVMP